MGAEAWAAAAPKPPRTLNLRHQKDDQYRGFLDRKAAKGFRQLPFRYLLYYSQPSLRNPVPLHASPIIALQFNEILVFAFLCALAYRPI
jgi:hypothetical protein